MDYAAIEDLSEGLLDVGTPSDANENLPEASAITGRTIRHQKQDLPKMNADDEDLDLDL